MKPKHLLLILPFISLLFSCKESDMSDLNKNSIIPKPMAVTATGDYFTISEKTRISYNSENTLVVEAANFLSNTITDVAGIELSSGFSENVSKSKRINLAITENANVNKEWYSLDISKKRILITASQNEGLYRGIQTIQQLLLLKESDVSIDNNTIKVPTGLIEDSPEYEYRGSMLDVARHFFTPETVKSYIDILALYKINVLHLHLSDDQGWRIEIKSWPNLTEHGGLTEVGGGEGGFYTQEEYKDIVEYAAKRFITIVPEIDMPGHTNAALASYAELNCNGKATELYTGTSVGFSTLCTRSEITYQFIDDVIREISEMSPGPYFHMGGDESHVTELPDYIYFVNRVKDIVASHGKTLLGWDEISNGAITEGDVAQYWASSENALRAVEKGAKLLISPAKQCYLDMKYDADTELGLSWAAFIEVDDAYNWDPLKLVEGIGREDILGIESPLWAETIETLEDIEQLAFPRLIGHAEIGWCNADSLSWEDYRARLAVHGILLDQLGVNYYKSALIDW